MQIDQLHTRLFALAKKGTQDTHFDVKRTSRAKRGRDYVHAQPSNIVRSTPFAGKQASTSHEVVKNLKNLQFTLFD